MRNLQRYLFNAYYQWIVDSDYTPYLIVNAMVEGVDVPVSAIDPMGRIVLDLSPSAVSDFAVTDTVLMFNARFNRVSTRIRIPFSAMDRLYGRNTTFGFDLQEDFERASLQGMIGLAPEAPVEKPAEEKKRPALMVVK